MKELLVEPGHWASTDACVVYSFFASIGILLGYTQKHKDFVQKIYDNVFYFKKPEEGSIEYDMLVSLGQLPPTYAANEMRSLSKIQKEQVKVWYEEILSLEPQMDANPFLLMMLKPINNFIKNDLK